MSPNPGAQPSPGQAVERLIDCLGEYLEEYLARPDVVEQLKPVEALFVELSKVFAGMFLAARTIAQRTVECSPSKAYEPFLIERGVKPVWARQKGPELSAPSRDLALQSGNRSQHTNVSCALIYALCEKPDYFGVIGASR